MIFNTFVKLQNRRYFPTGRVQKLKKKLSTFGTLLLQTYLEKYLDTEFLVDRKSSAEKSNNLYVSKT